LPPPKYKNLGRFGFLGFLALLITMNLLLTSCVEEPEAPQIEVNENAQIAQVKSWFEENKTKLRLPERGSNLRSESQELILPFFEKEPDWDKFHHYYFPDGREVFEISLENATKYFPTTMLDSFPNRNPAEVVIQNIMFVKHETEERFDPLIARYYPANSNNEISFPEINYQAIDVDWSGTLELFTYDEHHFVGFEIQDGEIVRNYTYSPNEGNITEGLKIMDVRCTTRYYPVGYKVCAGGYCTTTINYYIAETSCSGSSGIDNSTSYSFPPGDWGSGETANTDGNGTCSTCDYNPPTVPKPGLINNLTNPCARDRFNEIKKSGLNLFGQSSNPDGIFNISNEAIQTFYQSIRYDYNINNSDHGNGTSALFNRLTGKFEISVNLNNHYLNTASQLSIARTIIHESVHAYILFELNTDPSYFSDFYSKYEQFLKRRNPSMNRAQHELMGEYVDMMALSLKTWDILYGNGKQGNPILEDNYYRSMAFAGLFKDKTNIPTDSFKALVPNASDRQKILDIIKNEQEGTNPKGTLCK